MHVVRWCEAKDYSCGIKVKVTGFSNPVHSQKKRMNLKIQKFLFFTQKDFEHLPRCFMCGSSIIACLIITGTMRTCQLQF